MQLLSSISTLRPKSIRGKKREEIDKETIDDEEQAVPEFGIIESDLHSPNSRIHVFFYIRKCKFGFSLKVS